jgi:hypothetical protein
LPICQQILSLYLFKLLPIFIPPFFIGIGSNLLPKQPFIIAISFQIIANIPTTLSIEGIESNLLLKQLFVANGFNQFFPSAHR